jgi:hypothetical protein
MGVIPGTVLKQTGFSSKYSCGRWSSVAHPELCLVQQTDMIPFPVVPRYLVASRLLPSARLTLGACTINLLRLFNRFNNPGDAQARQALCRVQHSWTYGELRSDGECMPVLLENRIEVLRQAALMVRARLPIEAPDLLLQD